MTEPEQSAGYARTPENPVHNAVEVIRVGRDDLAWPFRDGAPRYHHDPGGSGTVMDPFPCYAHNTAVVWDVVEACAAHWPGRWPVTYHVSDLEDIGRTNGWSSYRHVYDDDAEKWVIGHGDIFLSGKRIPPHPAVTRYVTAHEYGHQVQWWIEQQRGVMNKGELIAEYAQMRGIEPVERYGGGVWHRHVDEVFACDFRILVVGVETGYWPHAGTLPPQSSNAARKWWADACAERWMHERAVATAALEAAA